MNFRNNKKQDFEIFSGSFSDIMFFLMLFFLIASTMITPGAIKIALPQANKAPSIDKQTEKIAITITKDLKYYINDKQIQFSEIEPQLRMLKKQNENAYAIVRSDNTISVQSLVDVFQIGSKVEMKMVLATTKRDDGF